MPAMDMKEAALIQSAAVAMPLAIGMHVAAGYVEFPGGCGPRPDGDADIQCEAAADEEVGE